MRRKLCENNGFDFRSFKGAQPEDSLDELRKKYKKLALLIHPDKCQLPRTGDAFDSCAYFLYKFSILVIVFCEM